MNHTHYTYMVSLTVPVVLTKAVDVDDKAILGEFGAVVRGYLAEGGTKPIWMKAELVKTEEVSHGEAAPAAADPDEDTVLSSDPMPRTALEREIAALLGWDRDAVSES